MGKQKSVTFAALNFFLLTQICVMVLSFLIIFNISNNDSALFTPVIAGISGTTVAVEMLESAFNKKGRLYSKKWLFWGVFLTYLLPVVFALAFYPEQLFTDFATLYYFTIFVALIMTYRGVILKHKIP
jgi:ABC-type polysaccharide/polyol phosphate export permease